jgi:hypothetical protein
MLPPVPQTTANPRSPIRRAQHSTENKEHIHSRVNRTIGNPKVEAFIAATRPACSQSPGQPSSSFFSLKQ